MKDAELANREPGHTRHLSTALGLAAIALPGALPGSHGRGIGEPDPIAFLTWLAFVAPAIGALAGAVRVPAWPHAAAIPGAWMLLLVGVDVLGQRDLATPVWAAAAVAGLFAIGHAVGRWSRRENGPAAAATMLAISALLVLLPVAGAILRAPWPGNVSAILLDASPMTLLAECSGIDWLRHPAVYDAAGTSDIDPRTRTPYAPVLAGGIVLVLGCASAFLAERFARARQRRAAAAPPAPIAPT